MSFTVPFLAGLSLVIFWFSCLLAWFIPAQMLSSRHASSSLSPAASPVSWGNAAAVTPKQTWVWKRSKFLVPEWVTMDSCRLQGALSLVTQRGWQDSASLNISSQVVSPHQHLHRLDSFGIFFYFRVLCLFICFFFYSHVVKDQHKWKLFLHSGWHVLEICPGMSCPQLACLSVSWKHFP